MERDRLKTSIRLFPQEHSPIWRIDAAGEEAVRCSMTTAQSVANGREVFAKRCGVQSMSCH
jgi:hypothetical protein